jgi:hypothetical protein
MPRQKGFKCDAQTRQNMSIGASNRESRIIKRYGLTKEFYDEQVAAGKFWCSVCKSFQTEKSGDKRSVRCKACQKILARRSYVKYQQSRSDKRRTVFLRTKYGVDDAWFDAKLKKQGGTCALCGKAEPTKRNQKLCVDHNHENGRVRGLLCCKCNSALERLESIPDWPERARAYLERFSCLSASNSSEKYLNPATGPCGRWRSSGKYPVGKKTSSESFGRRQ